MRMTEDKAWETFWKRRGQVTDERLLPTVQEALRAGYNTGYAEGEYEGARDATDEMRDRAYEAFSDGMRR